MDPCRFFLQPLLLVSLSRPKHGLECVEFAKYSLFQAARLVDKIRSRLFRCVGHCTVKLSLNLFGENKICKFVWHVLWPCAVSDVSNALEKHWRLIWPRLSREVPTCLQHALPCTDAVSHIQRLLYQDPCGRPNGRQVVVACSHQLSAWSEKTFRQLKLDHKLRQPVNAGKLFGDLSESTRNFLCFVGQVMLASHLRM